jgi:hypothetical protein
MRPDALLVILFLFQPSPRDLVRYALGSLGGEAKARAIAAVIIGGSGYVSADTGIQRFVFVETRDNRRPELVQDVTMVVSGDSTHRSVRTLHEGDRGMDAWFTEAPENVLLAALDAPDLVSDGDRDVRFTWHGRPVRVWLVPALTVELDSAYTTYRHWQAGYPRQWQVTYRGKTIEFFQATAVQLSP